MARDMGPFRDSQSPLLGSPGPGPMYRLNPPLIGPDSKDDSVIALFHFQYYSLHTNINQNVKKMSS